MNRIDKVRKQAVFLAASGHDVLFVSKDPEDDLGEGPCLVFGSMNEEPDAFLCVRRLLNELNAHLIDHGLELEFTIRQLRREERRRLEEENE